MNDQLFKSTFAALGRKAGSPKVLRRLSRSEKMHAWEEDPEMLKRIAERFWSHVSVLGIKECWIWTADTSPFGYGRMNICGDVWNAHRIAFWLHHRKLNHSLHVCHHCDNPPCCNPHHLFQGSDLDNQRDANNKGRHLRGTEMHNVILNEEIVRQIRLLYVPRKCGKYALAKLFRVHPSTIQKVYERRSWAWVK